MESAQLASAQLNTNLKPPKRDQYGKNITYETTIYKINQEIEQEILPPYDLEMIFKIYSKINKHRHGSMLIIPADKDKYNAFRIDLSVENDAWCVKYNVNFASSLTLKYDIDDWKYVGKTETTMRYLTEKLKLNCLQFGSYNSMTNNCQDFIHKYSIRMPNFSAFSLKTDRMRLFQVAVVASAFTYFIYMKRKQNKALRLKLASIPPVPIETKEPWEITSADGWKGSQYAIFNRRWFSLKFIKFFILGVAKIIMGKFLLSTLISYLTWCIASSTHKIIDRTDVEKNKDKEEALKLQDEDKKNKIPKPNVYITFAAIGILFYLSKSSSWLDVLLF
eukprot:46705_1